MARSLKEEIEIQVTVESRQAENAMKRVQREQRKLATDQQLFERGLATAEEIDEAWDRVAKAYNRANVAQNRLARSQRRLDAATDTLGRRIRRQVANLRRLFAATHRARRAFRDFRGTTRRLATMMVGSEGTMDAFRKVLDLTIGEAFEYNRELAELDSNQRQLYDSTRQLADAWMRTRAMLSQIMFAALEASGGFEDLTQGLNDLIVEMGDASTQAGRIAREIVSFFLTAASTLARVFVATFRVPLFFMERWEEFQWQQSSQDREINRNRMIAAQNREDALREELNLLQQQAKILQEAGFAGMDPLEQGRHHDAIQEGLAGIARVQGELAVATAEADRYTDEYNQTMQERSRSQERFAQFDRLATEGLEGLTSALDNAARAAQGLDVDPLSADLVQLRGTVMLAQIPLRVLAETFEQLQEAFQEADREARRRRQEADRLEAERIRRRNEAVEAWKRQVELAAQAEITALQKIQDEWEIYLRLLDEAKVRQDEIFLRQRQEEKVAAAGGIVPGIGLGAESPLTSMVQATKALPEMFAQAAVDPIVNTWSDGLNSMGEALGQFILGAENAFDELGRAMADTLGDALGNMGSAFTTAAAQALAAGGVSGPFGIFMAIGGMFSLAAGLLAGLAGGRGDSGGGPNTASRAPDVLSTIRPEVSTGGMQHVVQMSIGTVFSPEESTTAVHRLARRNAATNPQSRPRQVGLLGG